MVRGYTLTISIHFDFDFLPWLWPSPLSPVDIPLEWFPLCPPSCPPGTCPARSLSPAACPWSRCPTAATPFFRPPHCNRPPLSLLFTTRPGLSQAVVCKQFSFSTQVDIAPNRALSSIPLPSSSPHPGVPIRDVKSNNSSDFHLTLTPLWLFFSLLTMYFLHFLYVKHIFHGFIGGLGSFIVKNEVQP